MHLTCFYPVCIQIDPALFIQNLFACRLLCSMVFFCGYLRDDFCIPGAEPAHRKRFIVKESDLCEKSPI